MKAAVEEEEDAIAKEKLSKALRKWEEREGKFNSNCPIKFESNDVRNEPNKETSSFLFRGFTIEVIFNSVLVKRKKQDLQEHSEISNDYILCFSTFNCFILSGL